MFQQLNLIAVQGPFYLEAEGLSYRQGLLFQGVGTHNAHYPARTVRVYSVFDAPLETLKISGKF